MSALGLYLECETCRCNGCTSTICHPCVDCAGDDAGIKDPSERDKNYLFYIPKGPEGDYLTSLACSEIQKSEDINTVISRLNEFNHILAMSFCPSGCVSTNDMYIPVSKGKNTRRAYYMKSQALIGYQESLFKRMTENYGLKIVKFLDYCKENFENLGFEVNMYIGMPDMYYKQKSKSNDLRPYDISNYVKSTEDIIANRLEIDDKYNMELHVMKYKSSEDYWRFTIIIKPTNYSSYIEDLFINKLLMLERREKHG